MHYYQKEQKHQYGVTACGGKRGGVMCACEYVACMLILLKKMIISNKKRILFTYQKRKKKKKREYMKVTIMYFALS